MDFFIISFNLLNFIKKFSPGLANWILTKSSLPKTNSRAAFHILNNMELNLTQALSKSTFSQYELTMIENKKATFYVDRTSLYIQNAAVIRDDMDFSNTITFIVLIYQQDKWIDIRNALFNITGTTIQSFDPLNLYFDSLYIATYAIRTFMYIKAFWNYPEAMLSGTVFANNITVDTSNQQSFTDDLVIFGYTGPANMTANNFNLTRYSNQKNLPS